MTLLKKTKRLYSLFAYGYDETKTPRVRRRWPAFDKLPLKEQDYWKMIMLLRENPDV